MKTFLSLFLVLFISWGSTAYLQPLFATDVYQGQVIDEETGQPLIGAAVTVVWYRTPFVQQERSLYFQNAQEAETDSRGKFYLPVSPGTDWNPFTVIIKEPTIVIYQPGYEPVYSTWLVRMGFKSHTEFAAALKKGFVVKLVKLKTEKEKRQFLDGGQLHLIGIPSGAIPILEAAISRHRVAMGYSPLLK